MKTIAYLTVTGLALVQGAHIRGKDDPSGANTMPHMDDATNMYYHRPRGMIDGHLDNGGGMPSYSMTVASSLLEEAGKPRKAKKAARKAKLEFDQTVLPGMTMVDDIDIPASKAEIEAAKNKLETIKLQSDILNPRIISL